MSILALPKNDLDLEHRPLTCPRRTYVFQAAHIGSPEKKARDALWDITNAGAGEASSSQPMVRRITTIP
jgi:hypothetical protein